VAIAKQRSSEIVQLHQPPGDTCGRHAPILPSSPTWSAMWGQWSSPNSINRLSEVIRIPRRDRTSPGPHEHAYAVLSRSTAEKRRLDRSSYAEFGVTDSPSATVANRTGKWSIKQA